jgi:phosphinothricin acetyltransferase
VIIRLAAIDDITAILAISNHYALTTPANFAIEPEPLEQWQRDFEATREKYPWFVAIDDQFSNDALSPPSHRSGTDGNRVFGFAKASPWKGRCAYAYAAETTVYVAPGLHRRGVGRALYATLLETLERQGYRTLLGGITLPNDASVGLHEALGFRKVAELVRVGWKFDRWHNVGYWEKVLGDATAPPETIKSVAETLSRLQFDRQGLRLVVGGASR